MQKYITVKGAHEHNLKNISIKIPINKITVVTGLSGSGKSSLVIDTISTEGKRRYIETFSSYARQFLDRVDKPKIEEINGLLPSIAIEQVNPVKTSRSTVGTMTELSDYFKLLFSRAATLFCEKCLTEIKKDSIEELSNFVIKFEGKKIGVIFKVKKPKTFSNNEFQAWLSSQGFTKIFSQSRTLVNVIAGRFVINDNLEVGELREALELASKLGKNYFEIVDLENKEVIRTCVTTFACSKCKTSYKNPRPALFSFNSPIGACRTCKGFGKIIGLDLSLIIPDETISLREGAIKPFNSNAYSNHKSDLLKYSEIEGVPIDIPYEKLNMKQKKWVLEGSQGNSFYSKSKWRGVYSFFSKMEKKSYKMHVRVFLSRYRSYDDCDKCKGKRLKKEPLNWKIKGKDIHDWSCLELVDVEKEIKSLSDEIEQSNFSFGKIKATTLILDEIKSRVSYLNQVGLGYLRLERQSRTLSGGEVQRINLTTALGSSLTNTLFILDEPSTGLHHKDISNLINVIKRLKNTGNTILIVEHDSKLIAEADMIFELGPGPGEQGGKICFKGSYDALLLSDTITGKFLRKKGFQKKTTEESEQTNEYVEIRKIKSNNLKNIDIKFPKNKLTCITGISGSGKSTLVENIVFPALSRTVGKLEPVKGTFSKISGHEGFSDVVYASQKVLHKTSRSNPALYIGIFTPIRDLFAKLKESKAKNFTSSHFSFNSTLGRCSACDGTGYEQIELQFLSDISLECVSCKGKKYKDEILEIKYRGLSIYDVLNLTVSEAYTFFLENENIKNKLARLKIVGLDYLKIGQSISTLSGGELQRLKIAEHLNTTKRITVKSKKSILFIFDEPTTGLHLADVEKLISALQKLLAEGHTVIVIEHCLEFIMFSDWIIELGPGAGVHGGKVLIQNTLSQLRLTKTNTALALNELFQSQSKEIRVATRGGNLNLEKKEIYIENARENNLSNLSIKIPLNSIVVITGVSGSGKSTLAFDILYAEGRRRYLESLNAYARQFIQPASRPDFDRVTNIPPTVAVEQRITRGGVKSTIGTLTEISHFLRVLYVAIGKQFCPDCAQPVETQTDSQIIETIFKSMKNKKVKLFAPLVKKRKGTYKELANWALTRNYKFIRVDNILYEVKNFPNLERYKEHSIELFIAELIIKANNTQSIQEKIREGLEIGKGQIEIENVNDKNSRSAKEFPRRENLLFSLNRGCPTCERAFDDLDPRMFSFNSKLGWCHSCLGTGRRYTTEIYHGDELNPISDYPVEENQSFVKNEDVCPDCEGSRINVNSRFVRINEFSISDLSNIAITKLYKWVQSLPSLLNPREQKISKKITSELESRLKFLIRVGLSYLTLNRSAPTLSGGELQRIKLAAQLGSNLNGVCYVLDEPTIGLHPKDNRVLLKAIEELKKRGNSVVIIEHDIETILKADYVIDIGPGAGEFGGKIVAHGNPQSIKKNNSSVTGKYLRLSNKPKILNKLPIEEFLKVEGANLNNLKNIDVRFALQKLNVLTGVSGSGKSSLLKGVLTRNLKELIQKTVNPKTKLMSDLYYCKKISCWENFDKILEVDQSPIGKTPRSTPTTYINIWDNIRKIYAESNVAKTKGWNASHFSYNSGDGRCQICKGLGVESVQMNFLPNVSVKCESCDGNRFEQEIRSAFWQGKSISDVLNMSVDTACDFFGGHKKIHRGLELMSSFGLGYLRLGQPSSTLSGGEAQRLKLIAELQKAKNSEKTLYIFDEPTIGLHMADVKNLISIFKRLVEMGNTLIVIEHNTDMWMEADWIIELGPEGGDGGGFLVSENTPNKVQNKKTATGKILKSLVTD